MAEVEVSNKLLVTIVLLSLAVAFLGVWIILGKNQPTGLVSNPTGTVSANVQSTTDIFLKNSTVNFGNVGIGSTFDTSVNYSNASQFLLRNDGSVLVNVTITATALFNATSGNNSNYRFNVTNATNNNSLGTGNYSRLCGATNGSTWFTMPLSSSQPALCNLNFTDSNDFARIDIQITVPTGQAAGALTSTVTFTASQG